MEEEGAPSKISISTMAYSTDRIYNYTVSKRRRNVAKPGYRAYRLLDRACSTLVLRNLFANHDLALDRIHRSTNYPRHLARMIDRSMARRAEIRVPFLVCMRVFLTLPLQRFANGSPDDRSPFQRSVIDRNHSVDTVYAKVHLSRAVYPLYPTLLSH